MKRFQELRELFEKGKISERQFLKETNALVASSTGPSFAPLCSYIIDLFFIYFNII